ncbi:hypothetical protein Bhyg_04303 [Pseudolycoriella hygida]|uniref:Uncharacterized protein n=1 Tax=Pseudolycoriella hygida TaxID=35572 RepID=A0A9Q0S9Z5_9DIPT|nr:hypothetical protein Bhyg_04303 [Pseudolycoriella hygida]
MNAVSVQEKTFGNHPNQQEKQRLLTDANETTEFAAVFSVVLIAYCNASTLPETKGVSLPKTEKVQVAQYSETKNQQVEVQNEQRSVNTPLPTSAEKDCREKH